MNITPQKKLEIIDWAVERAIKMISGDKEFMAKPYPQEGWSDTQKLDHLMEEIEDEMEFTDATIQYMFQEYESHTKLVVQQAAKTLMLSLTSGSW